MRDANAGAGAGRRPLLIALPPSEGKAPGGHGPPLDLASLSGADVLTRPRTRVLRSLVKVAAGARGPKTTARARAVLGLSEGLAGELATDAALLESPTMPAAERYTGVLYDHLSLGTLDAAARARAAASVVIVSALWGAVRPDDPIPAYRLSAGVTLPGVGKLGAFWKAPLARALPTDALVVDCRSAAYAGMWIPPAAPAGSSVVVAVRVFVVAADGTRSVVSHNAKATRGDVARALLQRMGGGAADASTPVEVAAVVTAAGLRCELVEPARPGAPWCLDVLLDPA
ncbi:peroxide stress protein YaaA [Paraconexibacter antarcticus]|uniref:Peroxide stress protein YaaA n=1 Tax=Paraconexibacter antarcticus TaxID=2949664 RepID=A0ABY5DQT6_9ACTN|nr:peroxide stress protein YaaA [Paraconexibacter antarcticus]UTI64388.1 peroxide stress protein YaaA [Paraconexibacter antarcticus]